MGAEQSVYPERLEEDAPGSPIIAVSNPPSAPGSEDGEVTPTISASVGAPIKQSPEEPCDVSLSIGLMAQMHDDSQARAALESHRRSAILDQHYKVLQEMKYTSPTKKKGVYTTIMGERMTPEKLATQQIEFEKLQRKSLVKAGKPLPEKSPLERDIASVVGLVLQYGRKYADGTTLITFGEVMERFDRLSVPDGGWSASCPEILLHAAEYARVKYISKGGSTWSSKAESGVTPRLVPEKDGDAVIELKGFVDATVTL